MPAPDITNSVFNPNFQLSNDNRVVINRHHTLNPQRLRIRPEHLMRLAIMIIVFHILQACELALSREVEALRSGVFDGRSGVQGEDVGLAVLLSGYQLVFLLAGRRGNGAGLCTLTAFSESTL